MEYTNSQIRALIDEYIHSERDRAILKRRLVDAMTKSIQQFGSFPIQVPAIPLISPVEFTLSLSADDVDAMRSRIEGAV